MAWRTFSGGPENPLNGKAVLPPSLISLRLELLSKTICIGTATGFVEHSSHGLALVTNRHVMTGRHQETNKPLDQVNAQLPDTVRIWYRDLATCLPCAREEPLFDDQLWPRWFEHPELGAKVDIAVLPLRVVGGVHLFPLSDSMKATEEPIRLLPTDPATIVGFPFSKNVAGFPVWTTGSIASELDFDYDNLPVFLVDARTRDGQSGAPVFFHSNQGNYYSAAGTMIGQGMTTVFLGIYSGRVNAESDIGMVWRSAAIKETLEKGRLSDVPDPDKLREAVARIA